MQLHNLWAQNDINGRSDRCHLATLVDVICWLLMSSAPSSCNELSKNNARHSSHGPTTTNAKRHGILKCTNMLPTQHTGYLRFSKTKAVFSQAPVDLSSLERYGYFQISTLSLSLDRYRAFVDHWMLHILWKIRERLSLLTKKISIKLVPNSFH